jgi:ribosomal protein S6--L-glutamate ligase
MKFCILSRSRRCYSTRRLVEAARHRGHDVGVLDTLKFAISCNQATPELFYKNKVLAHYDGAIPRIGASITFYGTSVVRQFEQMDVFCANSATGIANSRDKLRSTQILSRYDIGIPPTEFVRDKSDVLPAIERVGGAPVIIKLLEGTQGVGVILADSVKVAQAIIETLQSTKQNVLAQKFVMESRGKDIRAFVIGDRVVAAMRRVAQGDEFRSNVHRGGQVERAELDAAYEETAVRAAQIIGLRIAGVDMLETASGPSVMEVNSSPGLEGIEAATQRDIAGAIVDFVADNVQYPERSGIAGRTIENSGLRDRDIVVLSLHREGKVIPNPRLTRELHIGDRLLCYGKYANVKDLLPEEMLQRRRRKIGYHPEGTPPSSNDPSKR